MKIKVVAVCFGILVFAGNIKAEDFCYDSVAQGRVLSAYQLFKLLQNPVWALNSSSSLQERLSARGHSLTLGLQKKLNETIQGVARLTTNELRVNYIAREFEVSPVKADRLLLSLDYELGGLSRDRIHGLKSLTVRSSEGKFSKRNPEESIAHWVNRQQQNLFAAYEELLVTRLLGNQKFPNKRDIVNNKVKALDSAHAIYYDIEGGYSILGPRLIIKGFYRAGLSHTAESNTNSYGYQLHLNRFISQLIRFEGSLHFEDAQFIPELIFIETSDGTISLTDFKKRYSKEISYSDEIHVGRRARQARIIDLVTEKFMTVIVPNSKKLEVGGVKDFKILQLLKSGLNREVLQSEFIAELIEREIGVQTNEEQEEFFREIHRQVFTVSTPKGIGAPLLKFYVSPSFSLPALKETEKKPETAPNGAFTATEYRQFENSKSGGTSVLKQTSRFFKSTKYLKQRLKDIIELIPSKTDYNSLIKSLEKFKITSMKLSDFDKDFSHSRIAYRILIETFDKFNRLAKQFNSSSEGKKIPLVDLGSLLSREGVERALMLLDRYNYSLARSIDENTPLNSRLKEIERVRRLHVGREKEAIKELPVLTKEGLNLYRGRGERVGALDQLAKVTGALGVPFFVSGNTTTAMERILRWFYKDYSSKVSPDRMVELTKQLSAIKFGRQDAHNSKRASKAPADKIYGYLVLIARLVKEAEGDKVSFDPLLIYRPEQMLRFLDTIPSIHRLIVKKVEKKEEKKRERALKLERVRAEYIVQELSSEEERFYGLPKTGVLAVFKTFNKIEKGTKSLRQSGDIQGLLDLMISRIEQKYSNSSLVIERMREDLSKIYPDGSYLRDGGNGQSKVSKYRGARARVYRSFMIVFNGLIEISAKDGGFVRDTSWFLNEIGK